MRPRCRRRASLWAMLGWLALILVLGAPVAGAEEPQTPEPEPAAEPQQAEESPESEDGEPSPGPEEEPEEAGENDGQEESGDAGAAPGTPGGSVQGNVSDKDAPTPPAKSRVRSTLEGLEHHCPALFRENGRIIVRQVHVRARLKLNDFPDPIRRQSSRDFFLQLGKEAGKCAETLDKKRRSKDPPADVQRSDELLIRVEKLLQEIGDVYATELRLRKTLRQYVDDLQRVPALPVRAVEWPPDDICPKCQRGWDALSTLVEWVERLAPIKSEPPSDQLAAAIEAQEELAISQKRLCHLVEILTATDLREADRKARYYSWTETRRSFNNVISILENKGRQYWCDR